MVTGGLDNTLRIYDVENNFNKIKSLSDNNDSINSIAFSNCNTFLAFAGGGRVIKIYNV